MVYGLVRALLNILKHYSTFNKSLVENLYSIYSLKI